MSVCAAPAAGWGDADECAALASGAAQPSGAVLAQADGRHRMTAAPDAGDKPARVPCGASSAPDRPARRRCRGSPSACGVRLTAAGHVQAVFALCAAFAHDAGAAAAPCAGLGSAGHAGVEHGAAGHGGGPAWHGFVRHDDVLFRPRPQPRPPATKLLSWSKGAGISSTSMPPVIMPDQASALKLNRA